MRTQPLPSIRPAAPLDRADDLDPASTAGYVAAGVAKGTGVLHHLGAAAEIVPPVAWSIKGAKLGLAAHEGRQTGDYRRTATTAAGIGGGVGGAMIGAGVGTAIFPGIGTILGMIIGAISGDYGASEATGHAWDTAHAGCGGGAAVPDDINQMVRRRRG